MILRAEGISDLQVNSAYKGEEAMKLEKNGRMPQYLIITNHVAPEELTINNCPTQFMLTYFLTNAATGYSVL